MSSNNKVMSMAHFHVSLGFTSSLISREMELCSHLYCNGTGKYTYWKYFIIFVLLTQSTTVNHGLPRITND